MTTALSTESQQFKDVMRERVLQAFMGLIPAEKIDEMVTREVTAFFETEQLLTVIETKVVVDNPNYDPKADSYYDAGKQRVERPALAFGSKMTPFRQLVWSTLHEHLKPLVASALADTSSAVGAQLTDWATNRMTPSLDAAQKVNFQQLAIGMAGSMFDVVLSQANEQAKLNLSHAFMQAGLRVPV